MVETLFFDGSDKPFRKGIKIWTSRRQFYGFHASGFQDAFELRRVQRISVMDQVFLAHEEAVLPAQIASDLLQLDHGLLGITMIAGQFVNRSVGIFPFGRYSHQKARLS